MVSALNRDVRCDNMANADPQPTWDEGLRDQQRGVASMARRDTVLLAGPGTGKTLVLVRRIQYLIDELKLDPRTITALTFTRAAAAEMRERLVQRLPEQGPEVRVSTLHSYSLRELLRQGAAGLPTPVRVAGDWEERWVVVEELSRMLGRTVNAVRDSLTSLADDWDTLAADGAGWEDGYPDPALLNAWQRHREVYGYTLRGELVYQMLCELRSNPEFQPARSGEVILVDEYQDLNRCDLTAIRMLAERTGAEVFAAGDDDQSIYSFRHAHPAGIRGFEEDYPTASRQFLTECLRCGEAIVELANWLIAQEPNRVPKDLTSAVDWPAEVQLVRFKDQDAEVDGVCRVLKAEIDAGTPAEEILILLRSDPGGGVSTAIRTQLAKLEIETYLPRAGSSDDPALQMLLEYLVLSQDLVTNDRIDDLALRSLLELEINGIGRERLWTVTELALNRRMRFAAAIEHLRDHPEDFSSTSLAKLLAAVDDILERARRLAQAEDETFEDWLSRVCQEVGFAGDALDTVLQVGDQIMAELERGAQDGAVGIGFAQQLATSMSVLSDTLPARIVGSVTVTTMHGAKGLSADVVWVLQAEDEVMPGDAAGIEYDETRRLLYVSLTRARRTLLIGKCERRYSRQRFVGSRELRTRTLTRFIRDYGLRAVSAATRLRDLADRGKAHN